MCIARSANKRAGTSGYVQARAQALNLKHDAGTTSVADSVQVEKRRSGFLGSWNRQDLPSQEMKFVEAENLASSRQREVEPRALEGISSIFHPRGTPRKLSQTHDTRKMHQFGLF